MLSQQLLLMAVASSSVASSVHDHSSKNSMAAQTNDCLEVTTMNQLLSKMECKQHLTTEAHFPMLDWTIIIASVLFGIITTSVVLFYYNRQDVCERPRRSRSANKKSTSSRTKRVDGNRTKGISALRWVKLSARIIEKRTKSKNAKGAVMQQANFNCKDEVVATMMQTSLKKRSLEKCIERPMTDAEFMLAMKKVIKFTVDYYRKPSKHPISTAIRPNDIFNHLPQMGPENPEEFDLVWRDFHEIIMKGCIQWQHPRFHAFFPCGRSYPDILAETLISSLGTVGITWAANPAITELDAAMVNWLGRAMGIPETFLFQGVDTCTSEGGGWLADTASDAIFCALMAARHNKIQQEIAKLRRNEYADNSLRESEHELRARIMSKLVAYGSYECHSSFEKSCKMACVRCRHIEVFERDDWGMRREEVEKAMEEDVENGLIPFYLNVALGTTSTASSDHLAELTPLSEKYGVWIHVDASYAGSAWVVEKYRNNEGIDKVDSINVNLHKFFLTSASVTPFWTRHQKKYKEFFHVDPAYLKKKTGGNDLRNWGVQLTRRFKSLKVYMLMRIYGLNGIRAYIERIITMTAYMEQLILTVPGIRKFGKMNYGLFCVQYQEDGMSYDQVNNATKHLCEFVNNSHKMFFTHSNVRGHDIIRVAVTLERSTKKDVEKSVQIFGELVQEFSKMIRMDDSLTRASSTTSSENLLPDIIDGSCELVRSVKFLV